MKKILLIEELTDIPDLEKANFDDYDIVIELVEYQTYRFLKCKSKFNKSQTWDRDMMLDLIQEDDYDYGDPDEPDNINP